MRHNHLGIAGAGAPEFTVDEWFEDGQSAPPVRLADPDEPFVRLYFSRAGARAASTAGARTLQAVQKALKDDGPAGLLRFVPVQTVFECHDANAAEAAVESLARQGLDHLGVGHDSGTPPRTMTDYRTGGTPRAVLVGPDRTVLVDGFHLDPNELLGGVFHHAEQHPP